MSPRLIAAVALLMASGVAASPAHLTVDTTRSTVEVELCVTPPGLGQRCDQDASTVSGWLTISPDCLTDPANMELHDFYLAITDDAHLTLDWGWLIGHLEVWSNDIELFYAEPGPISTPLDPSGDFTYSEVQGNEAGLITYEATSLICTGLQGLGMPCSDTQDLSEQGANTISMTGTMGFTGRDATMTLNIDVSSPLDPNNPDLGAITIIGTIVAEGTIPLPTVPTFIGVLLGDITQSDLVCESDVNQDNTVDGLDVQPYVEALLGA